MTTQISERLQPIRLETPSSLNPIGFTFGNGDRALEVIVLEADRPPVSTQLRSCWKNRQRNRGVPLLVIALHGNRVHVCGPSGDDPTVYPALDPSQVDRMCIEALSQPDRHAALQSLRDSLGTLEDGTLIGLRNEGFLASHELSDGVPNRSDWNRANKKAHAIIHKTNEELLGDLGFTVDPLDKLTSVLKIGKRKSGVAVLLDATETPEFGSARFPGKMSPVSYALTRADEEGLDWVILMHGRKIRLYPVKPGIGVGRRGRTETWIECHTALLPEDKAAFLWLLFSAEALADGGSLEDILNASRDFAGNLADQLRERIYDEVIPRLSEGIAEARGLNTFTAEDLSTTYQMAMRILFRILFIAYGEDKDLLPYRFNGLYQKRSLKAKARELQELAEAGDDASFGDGDGLWQELAQLFKAVDKGNPTWGVPAYNGGLFASSADESKTGDALAHVSLTDDVFGPALIHLLLVPTQEGVFGPVDFRALGVREFGTIYEGLLESELSVAEEDLAVEIKGKNKDAYRPAKEGEEIIVPKGKVYLHNASGARKSTGSYYTKSFAVEHLLDRSLEPALTDHFTRLDEMDDTDAADAFFDFRVADIAMGSGHFLIAAVDRIEARFSGYLANRPLANVAAELDHLRNAAREALGDAADSYPDFEDTSLLRRQIARRCIYGVDINEVAVQLARLALWIHTFVPGLPLSLLDRTLVHGNSLIGIGTLDEIETKIREDNDMPLWHLDHASFLGDASEALSRMARVADATKAELAEAKKAWKEARIAVSPAKAVCDILTAARIEDEPFPVLMSNWEELKPSIDGTLERAHALSVLKGLNPLHFPIAFPEVFLRERSGFDVILGNPPWEEAMADEDAFWARHQAGLRAFSGRDKKKAIAALTTERPDLARQLQRERSAAELLRKTLHTGPFPGMGTGDADLYKAFSWRFWFLSSASGGRIGVVLPRTALAAKGSEEFRWRVFKEGTSADVSLILNNRNWFFEDVHPQYTIGLVSVERSPIATTSGTVQIDGPYNSLETFLAKTDSRASQFAASEVLSWNDSASLPLLPTSDSVPVFAQLRSHPRLDFDSADSWRARAYAELHATNDKPHMDLDSADCPAGFLTVYKGSSFDIWQPDTGKYYAWANPATITDLLLSKRKRASRNQRSVFFECDTGTIDDSSSLPLNHPRIAFRNITNRTNSRTVVAALIPPKTILTNHGPYFVWPRGQKNDEAYLLGVFSSIPLDWYARRFVEVNMNFFIIEAFPIPRPSSDSRLRSRVIQLAGRLACPDDRFADWANEVGVECGPLEEDEKQDMIHELDAVVAHLYGLTESHLIHIFETFHIGWDYQARLDATLKHYGKWEGKS